ncbi:MAG: NAD-dependent epimerase/dehydratase family protein [Candidatus Paceibacterales bacterium]
MDSNSKTQKHILLTGGEGFVGQNIIEQLGIKYEITAPTRQELDLTDLVAVKHFFQNNTFDAIIHAANIGTYKDGQMPDQTCAQNIQMFFNLATQLKPNQTMIFLGSGAEYDKRHDIAIAAETDFGKSVPADSYGFAKYVCSQYIEKTDSIIDLRCFGLYGKYEQTTRFISGAIIKALTNQPIVINQNVFFDYLYVNDLAGIIDYFLTHKAKHSWYIAASGIRTDLLTLANLVKKITGSQSEITVAQPGLNKEYTANNDRLRQETNFAFTSIEEGIKRLMEYYRKNI